MPNELTPTVLVVILMRFSRSAAKSGNKAVSGRAT